MYIGHFQLPRTEGAGAENWLLAERWGEPSLSKKKKIPCLKEGPDPN